VALELDVLVVAIWPEPLLPLSRVPGTQGVAVNLGHIT
jgi:hypothetical protein